jgi:superfamily II DNA or RNA helicase
VASSTVYPAIGSVVHCRGRQWIVLPSDYPDTLNLQPISGDHRSRFGIHTALLELDPIQPDRFPIPPLDNLKIADTRGIQLLTNAVRMSLRSGSGAFRCFGNLSVRARPYQLVPLMMALRQDTTRLLIADDVGVGKTIEAGLILRELLDRRDIDRIAVLCPPQLCDQWQRELQEKFHIEAVVVRSGTVSRLERDLPGSDRHIFEFYRHLIVSLDYVKSDKRRASFLIHCPDCVVVDEAHTCANRHEGSVQQRYRLIQQITTEKPNAHLLLLTATPHSGIERSFSSLLGLLDPEFETWSMDDLSETQRKRLAVHFVQRRRADVRDWLGDTPFPQRRPSEENYILSRDYRELFDAVYDFARGLVTTGEALTYAQQRGRYWSALAIVRCVMSSPAAAIATLQRQIGREVQVVGNLADESLLEVFDDSLAAAYVDDVADQERTTDIEPSTVIDRAKRAYSEAERRQLRQFIKQAEAIQVKGDNKLKRLIQLTKDRLASGANLIVWCRYISTAKYVAAALQAEFESKRNSSIRAIAIHGEQSESEREAHLAELASYPQRILIATDCLSEGVNLQHLFSAVIHYDLPWNPNRLEQREGRVDRYGQTAAEVSCTLLFGKDNPVDGAVLDVLIRKAVTIHRSLGITVPVPMDSESISEAIFKSLFERDTSNSQQLSVFELGDGSELDIVSQSWERAVERERVNRTRFAQRSIKPEEIATELEEIDRALGTEQDVERFVCTACERLNASLIKKKNGWLLSRPPAPLTPILGEEAQRLTFYHPAPEGVTYVGRNHPIVETLAQYIFTQAFDLSVSAPIASRCGYVVTDAVKQVTSILVMRVRYRLHRRSKPDAPLLVEECLTLGFTGPPSYPQWLEPRMARQLLETANSIGDALYERQEQVLRAVLDEWEELEPQLDQWARDRAVEVAESHDRVRAISSGERVQVEPILPMDAIGLYVFAPR